MNPGALKVLIACEFSGTVRNAFLRRGFDARSCDLLPSEDGSNRHIRGDVRNILGDGWDLMMVAHPPCTRLCNSGVRWLTAPPAGKTLPQMWAELDDGAGLFNTLWNAPIEHVAAENPVMHCHARERIVNWSRPQIVQPWWFGHPEFKATGLYLRNLPPLTATNKLTPPKSGTDEHKRWSRVHRMTPGPHRGRERSRFYAGIGDAMAEQWGGHILAKSIREAA